LQVDNLQCETKFDAQISYSKIDFNMIFAYFPSTTDIQYVRVKWFTKKSGIEHNLNIFSLSYVTPSGANNGYGMLLTDAS